MLLTQKLLRYLHSVFDKDARSFTAFRLRHESGAFRWQVSERVLTGYNGDAQLFSVALEGYTIRTLINYLAALPGVTIISVASTEQFSMSACALMDGQGVQAQSNGDEVLAFTSLVWAYLESLSVELKEAKAQIDNALKQMSITSAESEWLDEWGDYFGIPRLDGETDAVYAPRIIAEVLRPRGNNKAIEIALNDKFGQISSVIDLQRFGVASPIYNGTKTHNGVEHYNAVAQPYYGLFKISIGYDLLGGADISEYIKQVKDYVERLRDAGTHLDSFELSGAILTEPFPYAPSDNGDIQALNAVATLADTLTAPTETFPAALVRFGVAPSSGPNPNPEPFVDAMPAPADAVSGSEVYRTTYSGLRSYNGIVRHQGGLTLPLSLS